MRYLIAVLLLIVGTAHAAMTNVYWRVDLNQGTSIIAYGHGATEADAWTDCFRLQGITRAMTAAETRKIAVAAVTTSAVRWCKNPMRFATVSPDPIRQATLIWTPPTANTDGSALTNLAGYRISYGTTQDLAQRIQIANPSADRYVIEGLAPGTYYFAIRAYNSAGEQSALSSVVSKTVL